MNEKVYPKPEDLGLGKHIVDVKPMPEFKDRKPIPSTHKHGVGKTGFKWWIYSFQHDGKYISIFANEENKALFDSGEIEINVVQKISKDTKKPVWESDENGVPLKDAKGNMTPVLMHFVNESKPAELPANEDTLDERDSIEAEEAIDDELPPLPF